MGYNPDELFDVYIYFFLELEILINHTKPRNFHEITSTQLNVNSIICVYRYQNTIERASNRCKFSISIAFIRA